MTGRMLSCSEIDSVRGLSRIKKAVYIMQCQDSPSVFRFGCIGGKAGELFNTAVRRLGQNLHKGREIWNYAAVFEVPPDMDPASIRTLEKELKKKFMGTEAPPSLRQYGGQDKFSGGKLQLGPRDLRRVVGR
jgi:hypothetical protein